MAAPSKSGLCLLVALVVSARLVHAVRLADAEDSKPKRRHSHSAPMPKNYEDLPRTTHTRNCKKCVANTARADWAMRCNIYDVNPIDGEHEAVVYEGYIKSLGKSLEELVTNQTAHSEMYHSNRLCEYPSGWTDDDPISPPMPQDDPVAPPQPPPVVPPQPSPMDDDMDDDPPDADDDEPDDPNEQIDASPDNPCAMKVTGAVWRKSLNLQKMKGTVLNAGRGMFGMKKKEDVFCKCHQGMIVSCGEKSEKPVRKFSGSNKKYQTPGKCACIRDGR